MSTVVKDLGAVSAYAYAVEKGYTGTEAEFAELMADYAEVGQRADDAADSALESKTAAQTAATTATNKASEATTAATTATNKAVEAQADADAAALDASQAMSAASTATTKATEATTAAATAVSAKDDAVSANTAAQSAKTAAQTAQTGAETAAASVSASAAQIATNTADISQLKSELTALAPKEDMLKAFPTDTALGSVASFADGANVPVKSLTVNIDPVQSGSGDPSPDNVRPISGWSEVNVEHTGANLYSREGSVYGAPIYGADGTVSSYPDVAVCWIKVKPSTKYTVSCIQTSEKAYLRFGACDANKNFITRIGGMLSTNSMPNTITTPSNCEWAQIGVNQYDAAHISQNDWQICIKEGTDNTYEPYSGQSINIPLGQTVYGGTLDVLSGELVIDRAGVDMGTLDWTYVLNANYPRFITNIVGAVGAKDDNSLANIICSVYSNATINNIYRGEKDKVLALASTASLWVRDTSYTDATAFKAAVTGQTLVYDLATSITVTLTPNELSTLLGANNIWADSGDSAVEYRADPTLYISRLTEPDADMVADANIVSGQYFMVGNTLYKATANIASGATISPNVNCTRKSLSEALNELNA